MARVSRTGSQLSRCGATSGTPSSSGLPSSPPSGRRPARAAKAEQLAATPDFNEAAIADRVRSELAEHRDRTFLIIDDLHELTSPEALTQLTRLLESSPRMCTRSSRRGVIFPYGCTSSASAGDLAEIRAADLRFTQRETSDFLEASGIALSEAGAAKLHQRTEGWAAGLRLAAMSLASSDDPERFVAEFSGSSRTVAESGGELHPTFLQTQV